ncbi:MAG TPA: PIN domain-containing protein [Nevskiaceae bacterium]|nr:PIN domain-containing protein [Nevskiaceae bacterium]
MKMLLDAATLAAALQGRLPVAMQLARRRPAEVAVSRLALAQVEIGLRARPRAAALYQTRFEDFRDSLRVHDFGPAEAEQAVRLGAQLQLSGETLPAIALIDAATALAHHCCLVSAEPERFRWVAGLQCTSWLRPASPGSTLEST